jgi:arylsulfatase A-like enzyme
VTQNRAKSRFERWTQGIGFVLVFGCLALHARPSLADAPPPNILFISLDTVRADFLTFRDPETARHMTELARSGTVFTQAISGSSWTLPSHVQMFTGTPPPRHGVESDRDTIDLTMPVLPEVLRQGSYFNAGIFTVRYLFGDYGFSRGFDLYRSAIYPEESDKDDLKFAPGREEAIERMQTNRDRDNVTSPQVVTLARRALERSPPSRPIFLFAHFYDPHPDFIPPAPWDSHFDPNYAGDIDGRDYLTNRRVANPVANVLRQVSDRDLDHIKALYRGEIAWTDKWIGELLSLFEEHQRLDNTLVVIVGDHGEEFFEHGSYFHRHSLYDELVRVPLLIVPPKRDRVGLVKELGVQVSLSDLMPTILDFAGLQSPKSVMGRSLKSAMYGEPLPSRIELLSLNRPKEKATRHMIDKHTYAIRAQDFKFIREVTFADTGGLEAEVEYFDLAEDSAEKNPIKDINDPRVVDAWRLLERELAHVRKRWQSEARTPDSERTTNIRESFEEELIALGYLVEGDGAQSHAGPPRPWGGLDPMPEVQHPLSSKRRRAIGNLLLSLCVVSLGVGVHFWRRRRDVGA